MNQRIIQSIYFFNIFINKGAEQINPLTTFII